MNFDWATALFTFGICGLAISGFCAFFTIVGIIADAFFGRIRTGIAILAVCIIVALVSAALVGGTAPHTAV